MKVHKGARLTTKSYTYYIEISNDCSLLAEFLDNPSQTNQTTSTEIKFKINAAIKRHQNQNNHIKNYIIKNRDDDAAIINTAIKLVDDEHNVMNKTTIRQRAHVGKAFSTSTHQRNNSITRDGNHVQFKRNPYIAT